MGFGIKLADATFTKYIARAMPYIEDTDGIFIFGGNEAQSIRNLSPNVVGGTTGTIVGGGAAGTYGDDFASFNLNYSFDSGRSYSGLNRSVISVSEYQADNHSSIVAPQLEVSRINGALRARVTSAGYIFGAGDQISLNIPYFQAVTSADGSGNDTAYRGVGGVLATATSADSPVAAGNIIFGPRGGYNTASELTYHKHYLALTYTRELSGSEMAEVYAWAGEYLSARGILLA
jgi:hypothetical protein